MHPNVQSSIMTDKIWKQPKSIKRWMNKDVISIYNGILLSKLKKNGNFAIYSNMDGLGGYYAKWDKSDKDK